MELHPAPRTQGQGYKLSKSFWVDELAQQYIVHSYPFFHIAMESGMFFSFYIVTTLFINTSGLKYILYLLNVQLLVTILYITSSLMWSDLCISEYFVVTMLMLLLWHSTWFWGWGHASAHLSDCIETVLFFV